MRIPGHPVDQADQRRARDLVVRCGRIGRHIGHLDRPGPDSPLLWISAARLPGIVALSETQLSAL